GITVVVGGGPRLPAQVPPPHPWPPGGAGGDLCSCSLTLPPLNLSEAGGRLEGHITRVIAHALLPGAPAGIHAIRAALQVGIDLADVALLDLEHLGDLPGVRLHRTCHHFTPIWCLEATRLATGVVEEGE